MKQLISSAIFFLALIFTQTLFAKVIYVNGSYTGSTANGTSWATPYKKMELAIAAAADGDEVWVAKGTYVASASGYNINNSVSIFGGFAGNETTVYARDLLVNKTIAKGFNQGSGNYGIIFNLKQNKTFLLDGLNLTNFGVGVLTNNNTSALIPGDRYHLTLNNCNLYDGSAPMVFNHSTDLTVTNCTFNNLGTFPISSSTNVLGTDPLVDHSNIEISNSRFDYGSSNSTIFDIYNAQIDISNCMFNLFTSSTVFSANECKGWKVTGCTFKGIRSTLITLNNAIGEKIIDDCIFEDFANSTLIQSYGSGQPTDVHLKISNTIFKNSTNCYSLVSGNTGLEMDNVSLSNISFSNSYVLDFYNGRIQIKNSSFEHLSSTTNYCSFMGGTDVKKEIDNVVFSNNAIPFIYNSSHPNDSTITTLKNSTFKYNTIRSDATNPSLMTLYGKVTISNSIVSDNTYLWGSSRPDKGLITINNTYLIITDSKFENNITNYQSGVLFTYYSSVIIDRCDFNSNENSTFFVPISYSSAGALYLASEGNFYKISKSNFKNNKSVGNGAVYVNSPLMEINECFFSANQSLSTNSQDASALRFAVQCGGTLRKGLINNCQFINNTSLKGTTVNISQASNCNSSVVLNQCLIENNTSTQGTSGLVVQGGISNISNTLFNNNNSTLPDFGIFKRETNTEEVNFYNCTFVKNQATGSGLFTGLYPNIIANSVFWGNGTEAPISLINYPILVNVTNSLVQGGFPLGTNIFDTDPKFVDFAGGNYRLSCQSPLINKGNNALGVSLFDLDGTARIFADTIDIGAYETHVDPALANMIPAPSFTIPASVCKDELIAPINTTANSSNYTYRWVWGDGQSSTQVSPTHAYVQAGSQTIQLTASNFCGQSNTSSKQLTVLNTNAPTISTVSVVCPSASQSYTTDATCQSIVWTVTGGTITSGQGTQSIHVLWGTGVTGNGVITLLATNCGTAACEIPVTVTVPIVPVSFQLTGPAQVCQGSLAHYATLVKDQSPATLYTWSIKGGTISITNKGYNITDIDVLWNAADTLGRIYLTTYNELLKCGKTDSFTVRLRPSYKITGTTDVCANTSLVYNAPMDIGAVVWQVTGAGNSIDGSGYATWGTTAGVYKIIAKPIDVTKACVGSDTLVVHVIETPVITSILGETELKINEVQTYTAQTSMPTSDLNYTWSSGGGTVSSNYQNTATIQRTSFGSDNNVSLIVNTKVAACSSPLFKLPVTALYVYSITGLDTICIGETTSYYTTANPSQTGDTYAWTSTLNNSIGSSTIFDVEFLNPGNQQIKLAVYSNGKNFVVIKNVFVKSSPSTIALEGPLVIDPAGLQTAVYTVKSPANANYTFAIVGGTLQSKVGNVYTVKWNGTAPFSITVQDKFGTNCSGVPVSIAVTKAIALPNNISASNPACLNTISTYTFAGDNESKNFVWSLDGGGSLVNVNNNQVTIEWNQLGAHILTLQYDRYGPQVISTTIDVHALPVPVISAGTICGSTSFNLATVQSYQSYQWFVDAQQSAFSTQTNPPITLEGMYSVRVVDNNGCINYGNQYIKQVPMPVARIFSPDNLSPCYDPNSIATTNIKLSTFQGQAYSYQWYVDNVPVTGTNTFTLPVNVPLNLQKYHTYKVQVTFEGCVQISDNAYVNVGTCGGGGGGCTETPVSFTVDPTSICQPYKLTANATTELGWDFGDGTTATTPTVSKSYIDPGIYNVRLTRRCQTYTAPVEVFARALFKLDEPGCAGQALLFKDLSVNVPRDSIVAWTWNFGDGTGDFTFTGLGNRNLAHTFATADTFSVRLTVTASNANGVQCSFTYTKKYTITAPPQANYITTVPLCTGNTYTFDDNSVVTYGRGLSKWTFSNGQVSANELTLQQFAVGTQSATLFVKDLLGCSNTKTTSFTVVAPVQIGSIQVTSKDTLLCNGRTVTLTAPLTANTKTYAWRKVGSATVLGTAQTYVVTAPGSYTVTYSPNTTCDATTAAVQINAFAVPNLVSGSKLLCEGNQLTISSNLSSTNYSFSWKQGANTLPNNTADLNLYNITTAATAGYVVTVTEKVTGCYAALPSDAITVNTNPVKPVIAAQVANICYNTSAQVYTITKKTGNVFSWYENAVKLASVDTAIISANLTNTSNYYVTVKNTATGCSTTSDNLKITVAPSINFLITGDTLVCEQAPVELSTTYQSTDFDFQWYKNNAAYGGNFSKLSFSSITLADSGLYTLKVTSKGTTNLLGCSVVSNTKKVKVKATAVTPIITGLNEFCNGNSVILSTNVNSNFVWNTGAVTPTINVVSGGIYTVTATNTLTGCTIKTSKTVTQNSTPDLNFVPKGTYTRCGTDKISFAGLNQYPVYKWFVDGQLFSTSKTIYPTKTGAYTLMATTAKGCSAVSDTMNINSLECACYVTNTNDTGDGSLREAINCSNDKPGNDLIKFDIVGTGPFVIKPLTPLPNLTDAVFIDGFSQAGSNVYAVVVDGSAASISTGLVVANNLSNVKITGLIFTKFNNGIVLSPNVYNCIVDSNKFTANLNTGIVFNSGVNNNQVFSNEFTGGGSAVDFLTGSTNNSVRLNKISNAKNGVLVEGGTNNSIKLNEIISSTQNGILLTGGSNNKIISNTIGLSGDNGILVATNTFANRIDSNFIGVTNTGVLSANQKNGIYISPNAINNTITLNNISGNILNGILVDSKRTTIAYNIIGVDATNSAKPNGLNGIYSNADSITVIGNTISSNLNYGLNIQSASMVLNNKINNNTTGGIYIRGNNTILSRNTISNANATVNAINLHFATAPVGNGGKLPAVFKSYRRATTGSIVIKGTSVVGDTVEIFYSSDIAQQALMYAGSAKTDAQGVWELMIPVGPSFNPNTKNYYVNTARSSAENTSELSTPYLTGCFTCICEVTNTNDAGPGSLRAIIDEANLGACLTIKFTMTAPDTIQLLSALSPLTVPVTIIGTITSSTTSVDPMIFIKGNSSFNGLVANTDGVKIINLGFTQFNNAVVFNSDYNTLSASTILNSRKPVTINGNNSQLYANAINTTWANIPNTFKADTLVYVTGSGNTIGGFGVGNKFLNGAVAAILVNAGTSNSILNNEITNSTIAISLVNGGNTMYTKPANMVGTIAGSTATIQGTAKPFDKIQLFSSTYVAEQATGFVMEVTADALGNWTATIPSGQINITQNNYFVATATSINGNTSPLSAPIRVGNFTQVCYVLNVNNAGDGSLREAVNCANTAGLGTNGVPARIEFLLPATPNEIVLASELVITNNYGVAVNARAIPVTIKTSTATLNCFKWSTNNFQVKNLSFENFNNALYCIGSNAVIDSNSFVNNTNAIYVNATDTLINQTIKNNYFTGGVSAINSAKGSLAILSNTFGKSKLGVVSAINGYGISAMHAATITIANNVFAAITKNASATSPSYANGLTINIEQAKAILTNNTITGDSTILSAAVRLLGTNNSLVSGNTLINAHDGLLIQSSDSIIVSLNTFKGIKNVGYFIEKSNKIKLTQNTVTGLKVNNNPISLNLGNSNKSNGGKLAPTILTSTYHNGNLFLIGTAEKFDEVELFYSDQNKRDLVKYINKSVADSTGTWIIAFPISALGSDTLFFRAVSTKLNTLSSEASIAFTPKLKICLVTSNSDSGAGTLRDAIDKANLNQCNLIQFAIPGSGVAEIRTASLLPTISTPLLIIDGTSQAGYKTGSPTVALIQTAAYGFQSQNSNQLDIYGMNIQDFAIPISITNSIIVDVNDNVIQNFTDKGIVIKSTTFKYGNVIGNTIKSVTPSNVGIQISGTNSMMVSKNKVSNFTTTGIDITGNNIKALQNAITSSDTISSVGLLLTNSIGSTILSDTIFNAAIGIKVENGNTNTIASNIISSSDSISKVRKYIVKEYAIQISNSKNCVISSNIIAKSNIGIQVAASTGCLVYANTAKKIKNIAVYLSNASIGKVDNNTLDSSAIGLQLDNAHGVSIYNNLITRSIQYGIVLNAGSDTTRLNANLIGARYLGDTTYARGAGILIKSSNNYVGGKSANGYQNYIKQNKGGGVIVDVGTKNIITYNYFYNNDVSKGRPTNFAIKLINAGNNTKLKPSISAHKWIAGKLHVSGSNNNIVGDSIHLYLGTGGYEETSKYVGYAITAALGKWEVIIDTALANTKLPKNTTLYFVSTATNLNRNTSPLSDMYIAGDCYITSLRDTTDNQYPLPNTMRMAMKCANGQANPVGVYFNVAEGGAKEVILQMKMQDLNNGYGVNFNGKNIPDGVIAGMNAQKKIAGASWTIAATNAKSTIANFRVVNASDGLEVLSDSIFVKKMRFDVITGTSVLLSNKRNVVDSCVFDSVTVGIRLASNAFKTTLSGNTFNFAATGIFATSLDSLTVKSNTFNNTGSTGINIGLSTHALILSNTFNSKTATSKSILWNNSKGLVIGNNFVANNVSNPVSIANSTQVILSKNVFSDSADVYVLATNVSYAHIDSNTFVVANQNSIKTDNAQHVTIIGNQVVKARSDAFNLVNSATVFVSKNTVRNVRRTSSTDSALCIHIHKGEGALQSNNGKQEPTKLAAEVKAGADKRMGIFVSGIAQPGDSIQLFFSDSIIASMNSYVVNAYTAANGTWSVKIPREFYHKDTVTWYHVIAVAISADSNTSKTSSVLHIPPAFSKIYVLNEYNAGPNSLRQALLDVTYSDLYSKVIFSINTPTVKPGPYTIKNDSLYDAVYSYLGFEIDGNTQKTFIGMGPDQRILMNGKLIKSDFGLNVVDSSKSSSIKNLNMINTKNGLRIASNENKIENINFFNTDSSAYTILDTAFVVLGDKNKIKNINISDYTLGVLFADGSGKNEFITSNIDSTITGITVTDSSYLNYIAKNTFTHTTKYGVLIDSAAADNKIENNVFGKQNKSVIDNAITINNSSNQTIATNRISYLDANPTAVLPSSAITIKGNSSNNFIYNNRIGLDSLGISVHTTNSRGIAIYSTVDGMPSLNSIVGNEINGTQRAPIFISNASQDLISENIIGGDSSKHIYGIDTTAIFVVNSINEQINDNTILGYRDYGIELLSSSGIQMHRNTIYSKTTSHKAINIHADTTDIATLASNGKIKKPKITGGILVDINTIKLTGRAIPNAQVEVYQSVKDTLHAIQYIDKAIASADTTGEWELLVPKAYFSYATVNSFTAQNHFNNNSSELSNIFKPTAVLCQLQNTPSIVVIEPLYTPCPGPNFNIDPALDAGLMYAWSAPAWGLDTVRTKQVSIADTTMQLRLKASDKFGCVLTRTTDVIFKAKPIDPNFIISSTVYAGDTIVLVDVSMPAPDTYTWYSSPGVMVLRSSDIAEDSLIGDDGNVYPKGVRFIQFIMPDSGSYSIRQTSIKDGCFVDQTRQLLATNKNPTVSFPYFVAPQIQNMYAYPNPSALGATVYTNITVADKNPITLTLTSADGSVVGTTELSGQLSYSIKLLGTGSNQLFVNNLASGIYILKLVTSEKDTIVFKVVVQ